MSVNIPLSEQKIVFAKSGNICAFPGCNRSLVQPEIGSDAAAVIGEIAHIVAASRQGPRGGCELDEDARNRADNLIVLCPVHHTIIDAQVRTFSVQVLRQMKADHERRVVEMNACTSGCGAPRAATVKETLYSTLLPLTHIPSVVFAAPSLHSDADYELIKEQLRATRHRILTPFLLKDGMLFTFCDLTDKHPFKPFIQGEVKQFSARELWRDPEGARRYKTLLNRAMYKYGGRVGVRYDPGHRRYFFEPTKVGESREIRYRLKGGGASTRKVVWQPITRATGIPKSYWIHLAASLNFIELAEDQWALAIRPERHLTSDGEQPLAPQRIGRRVTRMKARMYNDKYLGELQFWLSFLSKDRPRFILDFGRQSAVVDARLVWFDIDWPGVAHDEPTRAIESVEDDLFTLADLHAATEGEPYDEDQEAEGGEDEERD